MADNFFLLSHLTCFHNISGIISFPKKFLLHLKLFSTSPHLTSNFFLPHLTSPHFKKIFTSPHLTSNFFFTLAHLTSNFFSPHFTSLYFKNLLTSPRLTSPHLSYPHLKVTLRPPQLTPVDIAIIEERKKVGARDRWDKGYNSLLF